MAQRKMIVPPGGFAGFAQQTPAVQALLTSTPTRSRRRTTRATKKTTRKKTTRKKTTRRKTTRKRGGRLKKGSAAAKRRMAQLRAMKKKKGRAKR